MRDNDIFEMEVEGDSELGMIEEEVGERRV